MTYYPEITGVTLLPFKAVRDALENDPEYLDNEKCPYPNEVKDFLRLLAPQPIIGPAKSVSILDGATDKWAAIEREAIKLYDQIAEVGERLKKSGNPDKLISFFRTRTQLLEKIVGLQERALGLKQLHEFQSIVLDFIENHVSPEDRTKLMNVLREKIREPTENDKKLIEEEPEENEEDA